MKTLIKIIFVMIFFSLFIFLFKQGIFCFALRTNFSDRMASMAALIVSTIILLSVSKVKNKELDIFPQRFSILYIIVTIIFAIIFICTPTNFSEGYTSVLILFYGCVITPLFEELLFRGYIWNELKTVFTKEWKAYIISILLFALWHLGYIESISFRVEDGLFNIMIWKVITGGCFGIILGAARLKTKNCFSTMLLHGILNIFSK